MAGEARRLAYFENLPTVSTSCLIYGALKQACVKVSEVKFISLVLNVWFVLVDLVVTAGLRIGPLLLFHNL